MPLFIDCQTSKTNIMEQNELRIGNIIFDVEKNLTVEINDINFQSIIENCEDDKYFLPVPLSEEILLEYGATINDIKLMGKNERRYEIEISSMKTDLGEHSFKDDRTYLMLKLAENSDFNSNEIWICHRIAIFHESALLIRKRINFHELQNLFYAIKGEELS